MTSYLITGGTGLIGRHLLRRLLTDPHAQVHALVRATSVGRLEKVLAGIDGADRVRVLTGDLAEPELGLSKATQQSLRRGIDHLVHLGALYDMTAPDERNNQVNVEGTRRIVRLAEYLQVRCLHHVSSVAVAGEFAGTFAETDFDRGQPLPSPYHRTKFEAEQLVRQARVPWRVYRPAIVVGDSVTGEMDKVDGPYYFFPTIDLFARYPSRLRLPLITPGLGSSNIVPVDYVADALQALIHRRGIDGRAFHLVHPRPQPLVEVYNAFAASAGAPTIRATLPGPSLWPAAAAAARLASAIPGTKTAYALTLHRFGVPPEVAPHMVLRATFETDATQAELADAGLGPPPELAEYAPRLWSYWQQHLDPNRYRRHGPRGPLDGRIVAITGASSGIGRATAVEVARRGGIPLLLARRAPELEQVRQEISSAGGQAYVYSVDLTQQESVDAAVKQMLADHGGIDMLVNNAGRSIRRSVALSYDRLHDYERTMALNYFAPVRLILALLPSMSARRFGHIVNVSSIGVQTNVPRFSAYVASKAALDAFSRVASTETVGQGVTFSVVHMPLVRTPMIAPTKIYDRFPTLSPEQAADVLVDALERRPKQWGTKLGKFGAVANAVAPTLVEAVMHTAYLTFPDSAAAGGADGPIAANAPEALSKGAVLLGRLLPGVHL